MLQGYLQSNCVYVVLWEGVVTNVQIDIFNCLCSGYRDTTDRKSLLGRSGLVKYFMIWDGGWLGNDSQAFQSFNFVVEGDCGILYIKNLHVKQVSVQDLLFCACQ